MFLHTFLLILIAEMADKTQLMMMALTTRYRIHTVTFGMILGVLAISGLSVLAGDLIGDVIPMPIIQTIASLLFLIFGLTSLKADHDHQEKTRKIARFPLISIAFTFLFAELGDKTQLATVAIAAHHPQHITIFLAASLGLIIANLLGIFAGKFIFKYFSEATVKVISAGFFLLFGSMNLFQIIPYSLPIIIAYSTLLMFLAYIIFKKSHKTTH